MESLLVQPPRVSRENLPFQNIEQQPSKILQLLMVLLTLPCTELLMLGRRIKSSHIKHLARTIEQILMSIKKGYGKQELLRFDSKRNEKTLAIESKIVPRELHQEFVKLEIAEMKLIIHYFIQQNLPSMSHFELKVVTLLQEYLEFYSTHDVKNYHNNKNHFAETFQVFQENAGTGKIRNMIDRGTVSVLSRIPMAIAS